MAIKNNRNNECYNYHLSEEFSVRLSTESINLSDVIGNKIIKKILALVIMSIGGILLGVAIGMILL